MPRRRSQEPEKIVFTTFDVAEIFSVSPPTVVNWVNGGLLTAHRTPGRHRRISKAEVIRFAKDHGFPPPFGPDGQLPLPLPQAPPAAVMAPPALSRVLIVEDEPALCRLWRDYLLVIGGYEVEFAFSGFKAGLLVERFKPEVILLDIKLDQNSPTAMDGFQLLSMLESDPRTRSIAIIACTGSTDPRIEALVQRGALVGHLRKPFPLSQLSEAVADALAGRTVFAASPATTSGALLRA
ncbi:MAG: response regulator [Pseudomonadota bacterium]|nr:response regulator [Pseudomonadota bacterium]